MPSTTPTAVDQSPAIVTVEDPTYKPGDRVRVAGSRGRFTFLARRQNVATGEQWLDVCGGLPKRARLVRSVAPASVEPDKRRA